MLLFFGGITKPVRQIRHAWNMALERAGVTRHIRPYDLRHSFATGAIAAEADYGTVAALMGHKSPLMVLRHYQHVRNDQKKSVMKIFHSQLWYDQGCMTKSKGLQFGTVTPWNSWWAVQDLNLRPPPCKGDALPTELTAQGMIISGTPMPS